MRLPNRPFAARARPFKPFGCALELRGRVKNLLSARASVTDYPERPARLDTMSTQVQGLWTSFPRFVNSSSCPPPLFLAP